MKNVSFQKLVSVVAVLAEVLSPVLAVSAETQGAEQTPVVGLEAIQAASKPLLPDSPFTSATNSAQAVQQGADCQSLVSGLSNLGAFVGAATSTLSHAIKGSVVTPAPVLAGGGKCVEVPKDFEPTEPSLECTKNKSDFTTRIDKWLNALASAKESFQCKERNIDAGISYAGCLKKQADTFAAYAGCLSFAVNGACTLSLQQWLNQLREQNKNVLDQYDAQLSKLNGDVMQLQAQKDKADQNYNDIIGQGGEIDTQVAELEKVRVDIDKSLASLTLDSISSTNADLVAKEKALEDQLKKFPPAKVSKITDNLAQSEIADCLKNEPISGNKCGRKTDLPALQCISEAYAFERACVNNDRTQKKAADCERDYKTALTNMTNGLNRALEGVLEVPSDADLKDPNGLAAIIENTTEEKSSLSSVAEMEKKLAKLGDDATGNIGYPTKLNKSASLDLIVAQAVASCKKTRKASISKKLASIARAKELADEEVSNKKRDLDARRTDIAQTLNNQFSDFQNQFRAFTKNSNAPDFGQGNICSNDNLNTDQLRNCQTYLRSTLQMMRNGSVGGTQLSKLGVMAVPARMPLLKKAGDAWLGSACQGVDKCLSDYKIAKEQIGAQQKAYDTASQAVIDGVRANIANVEAQRSQALKSAESQMKAAIAEYSGKLGQAYNASLAGPLRAFLGTGIDQLNLRSTEGVGDALSRIQSGGAQAGSEGEKKKDCTVDYSNWEEAPLGAETSGMAPPRQGIKMPPADINARALACIPGVGDQLGSVGLGELEKVLRSKKDSIQSDASPYNRVNIDLFKQSANKKEVECFKLVPAEKKFEKTTSKLSKLKAEAEKTMELIKTISGDYVVNYCAYETQYCNKSIVSIGALVDSWNLVSDAYSKVQDKVSEQRDTVADYRAHAGGGAGDRDTDESESKTVASLDSSIVETLNSGTTVCKNNSDVDAEIKTSVAKDLNLDSASKVEATGAHKGYYNRYKEEFKNKINLNCSSISTKLTKAQSELARIQRELKDMAGAGEAK